MKKTIKAHEEKEGKVKAKKIRKCNTNIFIRQRRNKQK